MLLQAVNEESLKKLSEYVASLQMGGKAQPTEVVFYVRYTRKSSDTHDGKDFSYLCFQESEPVAVCFGNVIDQTSQQTENSIYLYQVVVMYFR